MRLARQSILKLSFFYLVQWTVNTRDIVDQWNLANSSECTPLRPRMYIAKHMIYRCRLLKMYTPSLRYEVCRKKQWVYQLMLGIIKLTHSRKLCSKRWGIKNQFGMENKKKSEGLLPIFFLLSLLLASLVQYQVKIFVKSNWFHDISFRVLSGVALLSYLYF